MENNPVVQFRYTCEGEQDVSVKFIATSDTVDIYDFHDFCKRFAAVVGYSGSQIEEVFGEVVI